MSKSSDAIGTLPPVVVKALAEFGEHLAVARMRRKESQRVWARRLNVSIPTLIRLERGDPKVSMGVYATATWLIGLIAALPEAVHPKHDHGALELDIRSALKRRPVRARASIEQRLARQTVDTATTQITVTRPGKAVAPVRNITPAKLNKPAKLSRPGKP
jgi:DNA-binding XRE family transcriptional regulator